MFPRMFTLLKSISEQCLQFPNNFNDTKISRNVNRSNDFLKGGSSIPSGIDIKYELKAIQDKTFMREIRLRCCKNYAMRINFRHLINVNFTLYWVETVGTALFPAE